MSIIALIGIREVGSYAKYKIKGDYGFIQSKLGRPNVTDLDDSSKVNASWGMMDEKTNRKIFVWCYKVAANSCTQWSAYGDETLLFELFGTNLITF